MASQHVFLKRLLLDETFIAIETFVFDKISRFGMFSCNMSVTL